MIEAHVAGYGFALPWQLSSERFLEVDRDVRRRLGQDESVIETMRALVTGSRVRARHVVIPTWRPDAAEHGDDDGYGASDFLPSGPSRAKAWQRYAPSLAVEAARAAIANWGGSVDDITHVVTTSTSGWSEPGLAGALIHELDLSLDTQKQELNFNGCFCGATCLRLARDLIRAGDARAVLVVAVETASVQYDPSATDPSSLVASALFGDGGAAFIVSREGSWRFEATGMSLVPNSRDMLRMSPDTQQDRSTYRMFLHRRIGSRLATYLREERGAQLIDHVVDRANGAFPALAVHPGGPAILEAVRAVFEARGWPDDAFEHSLETLYSTGNLGAAAVLLVLAKLLPSTDNEHVALFAFGPGVTVEWGLLRRAS